MTAEGYAEARRRRQRCERARERRAGRYVYVPAEPVREHVRRLLIAGLTTQQVALRAEVGPGSVYALLNPVGDRPPARQLRPETAEALLAVTDRHLVPADAADVDATGTRRRVRALMAAGWSAREIGRQAGVTDLYRTARGERHRVTAATALAVADVYERLAGTVGPSTQAANTGRRSGWRTADAWVDRDMDRPGSRPRPCTTTERDTP